MHFTNLLAKGSSRKQLSRSKSEIRAKLIALEVKFITNEQFAVFRAAVEEVIRKSQRPQDIETLESTVDQVAEGVETAICDITDPSTYGNRNEQVTLLRAGLDALGSLQPGVYNSTEGDASVIRDAGYFARLINPTPGSQVATKIELYDMMAPAKPAYHPPRYLKTCGQIIEFLITDRIAKDPELWARHTGKHSLTEAGYSWAHVLGTEDVQGRLEFVDVHTHKLGDYIVVLRNEGDKDIPVPLAVPRPHSDRCTIVREYLKEKWSGCLVDSAVRFGMPNCKDGDDVLELAFNVVQFGIRAPKIIKVKGQTSGTFIPRSFR